jgi:hypothetical protein
LKEGENYSMTYEWKIDSIIVYRLYNVAFSEDGLTAVAVSRDGDFLIIGFE